MSETIEQIMARMPANIQGNFNRFAEREEKKNINSGELAILGMAAEEMEAAERAINPPAPPPAKAPYKGKITQSLYVEKGCELSVWRNGNVIKVELRNFLGQTAYGKMAGVMGAEGAFGPAASEEDQAFLDIVFETVVGPERNGVADDADFNYSQRATCLWSNRDLTGLPHPRAFLVITWKTYSNGAPYPTDAILMDGDKTFLFNLQRQNVTSASHPQWKARCS